MASSSTSASTQDAKALQDKLLASVVATTRRVNSIVAAEDLAFLRTAEPAVGEAIDERVAEMLALCNELLQTTAPPKGGADRRSAPKPPRLEEPDDIDIHWSRIVDAIDTLLERADRSLDEHAALANRKDAQQPFAAELPATPSRRSKLGLEYKLRRANILKPQLQFDRKTDNFDTTPWRPLLTSKPHALVPLEESLGTFEGGDGVNSVQYKHPYETEILSTKYPDAVYKVREPIKFQPIEGTKATFVETYDDVLAMLEELKKVDEIAVDLEHHDFRTFPGLLSLLQISTRDRDWVVDTLKPWRHRLEVLNEVFADPKIVKVLHGSYMDIIWLQRDLGLYVVGLFDTFHASDVLGYPMKNLAFLLKKFADFDADKKYQMADWRIRPIPEEMYFYAQSDTHFLLYVYDMMRNELVTASSAGDSLIEMVVEKSKETSLQRYEFPVYDAEHGQGPGGWFQAIVRGSGGAHAFNAQQFAVLRAVHAWRDHAARRDDESTAYVLPQSALLDIARLLPQDKKALHALLHHAAPTAKKPAALDELFALVAEARGQGAKKGAQSVVEYLRPQPVIDDEPGDENAFLKRAADEDEARRQKKETRQDGQLDADDAAVRATESTLWGKLPMSSAWESMDTMPRLLGAVHISPPWVTSGGVAERPSSGGGGAPLHAEAAAATTTRVATKPGSSSRDASEDGEFTLKSSRPSAKRKADSLDGSSSDGPASPGDPDPNGGAALGGGEDDDMILLDDDDDDGGGRRRRRQKQQAIAAAEKAERKKQQRQQRKKDTNRDRRGADAAAAPPPPPPLDYSKAASVLHANRASTNPSSGAPTGPQKNAGGKGGKPPAAAGFNPYAQTGDGAPKPARKMHSERTGKSATFRK